MRFVVFIEGKTEREVISSFLRRWLQVHFEENIGVNVVKFEGWSDYLRHVKVKAHMHLNSAKDRDGIIAVIGLLDLYGPTIYPEYLHTSKEKYTWAKNYVQEQVGHQNYRQFFAVHELEAWLLSQPSIFPILIANQLNSIQNPESVNSTEPPAKLLGKLYQRHLQIGYKKVVHGKQLFAKLDPMVAYQKCPMLKEMLDEMATMARSRGIK